MTTDGDHQLQIISVDVAPLGDDKVILRVRGQWNDRRQVPPGRAQLLVEVDGRHESFPVMAEAEPSPPVPGIWKASFALPAWLEPHLAGPTLLDLGRTQIALPAPARPEPSIKRGPRDAAAQLTARIRHLESALAAARQEPSKLREQLVLTQAEANTRVAQQQRFDSLRTTLRAELDRVRAALEDERARRFALQAELSTTSARLTELRVGLAEAVVAREAAEFETEGLRRELERLSSELTAAYERSGSSEATSDQAESLLAETRAFADRRNRHQTEDAGDVEQHAL